MLWTHLYDLLAKFTAIGLGLALIIGLDDPASKQVSTVVLVSASVLALLLWWFLLRPLSSWLYAKLSLGTHVTFRQARRASVLFSPIKNMTKWHAMREVKSLARADRTEAIIRATDEVYSYYEERRKEWEKAPLFGRALYFFLWILLGVAGIGAFMNVAPFSWLAVLQSLIFNGSYHPLLNFVVVSLPIGVAMNILQKKLGVRSLDMSDQTLIGTLRSPGNATAVDAQISEQTDGDSIMKSRNSPESSFQRPG